MEVLKTPDGKLEITIVKPSNLHLHFRQDDGVYPLLPILAPLFAETSYYSVAMSNTTPPIRTGRDAIRYKEAILKYVPQHLHTEFHPLCTLKILWGEQFKTTPKVIEEAHANGIHWAKMYMKGVTTNSDDGVGIEDIQKLFPTFKKMAELGWILQIHGEHPGKKILCLKREFEFHPHFLKIHNAVPNLKIVFEHITDHRTIQMIKQMPKHIGGTLSTHYMYMTTNNILEPGTRPKNNSKPVAKDFDDMDAIVEAALSGDPHFFWGSDAAGHIISKKYCDNGACGCFPGKYDVLWAFKIFADNVKVEMAEKFLSLNGPRFYGLPIPEKKMTFIQTEPYKTDTMFHDIEIWNGGELLDWKVK